MSKHITIVSIISIIAISIIAGCTNNSDPEDATAKSEEWCVKGTTSEIEFPEGTQVTETIGVVEHEGREVCKAVMKTKDTTTSYYATQDSSYLHTIVKDATGKVIYESGGNKR